MGVIVLGQTGELLSHWWSVEWAAILRGRFYAAQKAAFGLSLKREYAVLAPTRHAEGTA